MCQLAIFPGCQFFLTHKLGCQTLVLVGYPPNFCVKMIFVKKWKRAVLREFAARNHTLVWILAHCEASWNIRNFCEFKLATGKLVSGQISNISYFWNWLLSFCFQMSVKRTIASISLSALSALWQKCCLSLQLTEAGEDLLPPWMYFNEQLKALQGIAEAGDIGRQFLLEVTAISQFSNDTLSHAKDIFAVNVAEDNVHSPTTATPLKVTADRNRDRSYFLKGSFLGRAAENWSQSRHKSYARPYSKHRKPILKKPSEFSTDLYNITNSDENIKMCVLCKSEPAPSSQPVSIAARPRLWHSGLVSPLQEKPQFWSWDIFCTISERRKSWAYFTDTWKLVPGSEFGPFSRNRLHLLPGLKKLRITSAPQFLHQIEKANVFI